MKQQILILPLLAGLFACAGPEPAAPKKELSTVVEGNNQFAVDMYRQIGKKPGNKFFSPYSISTALGMTYAGARENTAKEMASTLHFGLDQENLHPTFGELIGKIQGTDKKRDFQLTTANSLWGDKDFSLNAKFLRITQTDYQAGFYHVDFVNDTEGARKKINGWVEDKTHDKIKELIKPMIITKNTRLVLVNAIYFKASWMKQFAKGLTRPEEFAVPGAPAVKVPMMNQVFRVDLLENDDFQLAQIPYENNEVSMVVILPRKKDGLADFEKKFSARMLQEVFAKAKSTNVWMSLPKFKMTEEFDLGADLQILGMKDAFDEGLADFTGMEEKVNRNYPLFISKVVHKAFVDVHEEGTEAAAATAVIIAKKDAAAPPPPPPVRFNADHPFMFLVRHNETGSILFMGRVNDPR
jgi:serpin B